MKSWPFIIVTSCMLTGCALWTDFEPPETASPEHWKTDVELCTVGTWPDTKWWEQFGSSQLTAQIEEASTSNYDLKAAIARVQQADAQTRISGAALLPSIGASADVARTRSAGTTLSKPRIVNAANAALNASYELDFWGKNWAAEQSAQALADASRFDQETVRLTTLSATATTYFDILGTKERLSVAQNNLANAQTLSDAIQKRFKVGIASALDVAQQESIVASQRAAIPPLEQRLRQDLDAQAILLGKLPEDMDAPAENLADIAMPEIAQGLPSELLMRRPDVQSAEANLASAHANIVVARAAFFPSIQLTAGGGYQSSALSNLFRPGSMLWSIAASATQPIFEGGLLEGNLELQKARYDELLQDYHKAVISAFSDVEDALVAVQQTAAEEAAQQTAVATARQAYQLTQQQMASGIIDITTVLNTQRTLFSTEDALVQAKLSHLEAMVGLYKALGGGWVSALQN